MTGVPAPAPLVLGIDPGLRICGWGLVRAGQPPSYVACGVIRPRASETIAQRLLVLHSRIADLVDQFAPDEMAIEDPFVGALSPASALAIGQARAAAVLAGAVKGREVSFYAPAAVKSAVTGYGQSDKRQVQTMIKMLLGLDAAPEPADAADALAIALCHLSQRRMKALERTAR
jgi:crossover junction endodeoxyribonuclease RuvC